MKDNFDFDNYSRTFKDDDFLRQTMRTINGKPVPDEQLNLVRERIDSSLSLEKRDHVLDLCCGNGHLAKPFLTKVESYTGVDSSENLIRVAKIYLANPPKVNFICQDANLFIKSIGNENNFTKMLWYGSCQYFRDEEVLHILKILNKKSIRLSHIFIGNLPDRDHYNLVLKDEQKTDDYLNNHLTVFGKWRSKDYLSSLAINAGWKTEILENDNSYHGKHYRYDLRLSRS